MRATFPVDSVDATIRKTLFDSVTQNIKQMLGIKDIPTYYEGLLSNYYQSGSTVGEEEKLAIGTQRRVVIDVEETPNEHGITSRHTSGLIEGSLFADPRYNIFVMPIPEAYDVTFTVNVRSPSRNEINQLISSLRFRQTQGHLNFMTGGEFHYYIPLEAIQVLVDAHAAANIIDTTLPTVDKYVMGGMAKAVTVMSSQSGGQSHLAARHEVAAIDVTYDTIGLRTDKNESYYYTEITFSFTYDRPQDVQVIYPLYLAGNPIAAQWWPQEMSPFIVDFDNAYRNPLIQAGEDMRAFEWMSIPWNYTGEFVGGVPDNSIPLITLDLNPHETPPTDDGWILLFNIEELPIEFPEYMLGYFKHMAKVDSTFHTSIIVITMYAGAIGFDKENIRVDEELNVWARFVPEVHIRYSISINIQVNLNFNNKETLDTMRDFVEVFIAYIKTLYPTPPNKDKYLPTNPTPDGRPTKDWLTDEALEELITKPFVPTEALDQLGELSDRVKAGGSGMRTRHITTVMVKKRVYE